MQPVVNEVSLGSDVASERVSSNKMLPSMKTALKDSRFVKYPYLESQKFSDAKSNRDEICSNTYVSFVQRYFSILRTIVECRAEVEICSRYPRPGTDPSIL